MHRPSAPGGHRRRSAGVEEAGPCAAYDESHVRRLELILGIRGIIGTPLARIGELVAVSDDPGQGTLDVMETAQTIGAEGSGGRPVDSGNDATARAATASAVTDPAGASAEVVRLLSEQDWPDKQTVARTAVEQRLRRMAGLGVEEGTRYELALGVAVGTYEVSQLVVDMLRLAQTSQSIRSVEGDARVP